MKRKKKLYRIISFALSFAILVNGFFLHSFHVDAMSLGIGSALGAEIAGEAGLALYQSLENGLISSGAKDGFTNTDVGYGLVDAFTEKRRNDYNNASEAEKAVMLSDSPVYQVKIDGQTYDVHMDPDLFRLYDHDGNLVDSFDGYDSEHHVVRVSEQKLQSFEDYRNAVLVGTAGTLSNVFGLVTGQKNFANFMGDQIAPFLNVFKNTEKVSDYYTYKNPDGSDLYYFNQGYYFNGLAKLVFIDNYTYENGFVHHYFARIKENEKQNPIIFDGRNGPNYTYFWIVIDSDNNVCLHWNFYFYGWRSPSNFGWVYSEKDGSGFSGYIPYQGYLSTWLPVFEDDTAAMNAIINNDFSAALNKYPFDISALLTSSSTSIKNHFNVVNPNKVIPLETSVAIGQEMKKGLIGVDDEEDRERAYAERVDRVISQTKVVTLDQDGNVEGGDDEEDYSGIGGLFHWLADNILAAILAAITMVAGQIWEFFSSPITFMKEALLSISSAVLGIPASILDIKDAVLGFPMDDIKTSLKDIVLGIPIVDNIATKLIDIRDYLYGILQNTAVAYDGDFFGDNNGIVAFSNGLYLLILILFMLLRLFLHVLEFIFFIFRIPASTSLMPEYLLMGFNYLNEIHLPVLNLSLYALLQGLLYVVVFFGILGTLRSYVSRMKAPKS